MDNLNIRETLDFILTLQKKASCSDACQEGCTRPFLGPNTTLTCYNTRPISLFTCCTGTNWTFPYDTDTGEETSTVFRIENVEGNCATFRVLIPNESGGYSFSNSFFTIDLSCVLALRCLPDIYAN